MQVRYELRDGRTTIEELTLYIALLQPERAGSATDWWLLPWDWYAKSWPLPFD
jgi:hypothetical protein